jgi:hypothetical protein
MAYNKEKIYKQALKVVEKHNLFFIEEIVAYLPCSKPTFYDFFPVDSNEFNDIKSIMEQNVIKTKQSMRSKWYRSDNATLQVGLMKLLGSDEERQKLSQSHIDHTSKGNEINKMPDLSKLSYEELKELAKGQSDNQ